ncbi:organic cation transporter 1-like isoform X2 [Centruroides sculpturatus]|uniref:organic cation transporter 1-like isoform X2 n=1 Tax=Centruroides sculpturatus TaxID=218467 RepID=UPI000C6C8F2D|nr:organic cation transporter 1-like isoform X2 [Centruroides sculpturatus]
MDFDEILPLLDGYGVYQKVIFWFVMVPSLIASAFGYFNFVYVSGTPDYWCFVPELSHLPLDLQKNLSLPLETLDGVETHSKCQMYDVNYTQLLLNRSFVPNENWPKVNCQHGWSYDHSVFRTTLIEKFNVVCDKDWMPTVALSLYYVGGIVGSLWFGYVGDKWGRRIGFISSCTFYAAISIISCFPSNYIAYIVYRFLSGMAFPAFFQLPFVIAMEIISVEKRTRDGMLSSASFSVGLVITSGIAYSLQEWFPISLATSFPLLLLFIYFFFVPESPRWLVSQDRYEEAEEIVQKIAKYNKRNIGPNFLKTHLCYKSKKEYEMAEPSYLDLLKYPVMRKNFIILTFDWAVMCFCYPVFSFGVSLLDINLYLGCAISSAVEVPGIVFSWIVMEKVGRMWSMFITLGVGGLSCLCIAFINQDYVWLIVTLTNIGKFCIAGAWAIVYVYGSELFPTVLRNSALSASSLVASAASIGSPYLFMLSSISHMLPLIVVGIISFLSAILTLWLPETKGKHLPQTIEESEMLTSNFSNIFSKKKEKLKITPVQTVKTISYGTTHNE